MATDSLLNEEIKAWIEPWYHRGEEPPFSYKELIIMCLALHQAPMKPRQILTWVTSTFDYYRQATFEYLFENVTGSESSFESKDTEDFVMSFMNTFEIFDLPVTTIEDGKQTVTWLRFIGTNTKGKFPFLRLPAELRTTIYEMALGYPRTGISPSKPYSGSRQVRLLAATREYSNTFSFEAWDEAGECIIDLTRPADILSLLLVNKQIFQESVGCFYGINTFFFWDHTEALNVLKSLMPSRREHLRHLAFWYDAKTARHGKELFKILASLPHLRRLDIRMDEADWFGMRKRSGEACFTLRTMPGFGILAKVGRNINVEFAGDCPTVAAFWKPKIENQEQEQASAQETKKRKSKKGVRQQSTRAKKVKTTSNI